MKLFFATCLLVFSAFTANADSFVITGGSATAGVVTYSSDMQFSFTGSGFSMSAATHSSSTRIEPFGGGCCTNNLTTLGAYDGALNITDFAFGGFSINGVGYGLSNWGVFSIAFVTPQVQVPSPLTESLVMLTAPFELTANFHSGPIGNSFSVSLTGSGMASMTLRRASGNNYYTRQGPVTYTFTNPQAIPEPASLILLGSGLVLLVRKCRR